VRLTYIALTILKLTLNAVQSSSHLYPLVHSSFYLFVLLIILFSDLQNIYYELILINFTIEKFFSKKLSKPIKRLVADMKKKI